MIQQIYNLPANIAAFRATDNVTKEDFENTVVPAVKNLIRNTGEINYMLVLDTPIKNFTVGAWMQDAWMGLSNLAKWHKAAIITDSEGIRLFTAGFSLVMPGEFKAFTHDQQDKAIEWLSNGWENDANTGV